MDRSKKARLAIYLAFVLLIGTQFIPITRDNPPVEGDFNDHPEVKQVLKESCYDCHSNETVWPWYSHIAPASWLVASDVHEARQHLNFSEWQQLSTDDRRASTKAVWKEVSKGEMPPIQYLLMHPAAKPTESDKEVIQRWAEGLSSADDSSDDD